MTLLRLTMPLSAQRSWSRPSFPLTRHPALRHAWRPLRAARFSVSAD